MRDATNKQFILYGAGWYAKEELNFLISDGMKPVCLTDSDEGKHFTTIESNDGTPFEVLPFHEALIRYPEAGICITSRMFFSQIYNYLIGEEIPLSRIYMIADKTLMSATDTKGSQHCRLIGNFLFIDGKGLMTCCVPGYSTYLKSTGDFQRDIANYIAFCKQLRDDLNEGRLTRCFGCPMLCNGRSEEDQSISTVNIGSGIIGQRECNLKCIYCVYNGLTPSENWGLRSENILELMQQVFDIPSVKFIDLSSGEIGLSPYKKEILQLWGKRRLKGTVFTNALVYIKELGSLINERIVRLNVSLDAGTADTFEKIKGVNCFEKVVSNLKKYSTVDKCIDLKYILLDGVNCGAKDIDGFLSVAKKINAKVMVARDSRMSLKPLSDCEKFAIKRLVEQCAMQKIPMHCLKASLSEASDIIDAGVLR